MTSESELFPAVLQSNLIGIKFGMAEARRLNWAFVVDMYSEITEMAPTN